MATIAPLINTPTPINNSTLTTSSSTGTVSTGTFTNSTGKYMLLTITASRPVNSGSGTGINQCLITAVTNTGGGGTSITYTIGVGYKLQNVSVEVVGTAYGTATILLAPSQGVIVTFTVYTTMLTASAGTARFVGWNHTPLVS